MQSSPEDGDIDLFQVFATLWRGKWIISMCAVIAMFLGGYYAFGVAVPKYSASTRLAVQQDGAQVVDFDSVVSGVSTTSSALNTEVEVIRSRSLLTKLVNKLDLTKDPEFNPVLREPSVFSISGVKRAIKSLIVGGNDQNVGSGPEKELHQTVARVLGAISVSLRRDSFIIDVSVKTTDPTKSELIANTLAELYVLNQVDVKFQATEKAIAWLSERAAELEAELQVKEDAIKALRAGSDLISAEALEALGLQAKDVRNRLADTRATAETETAKLKQLAAIQAAGDAEAMVEAFSDPALRRLFEALPTGGASARAAFDSRFDLLVKSQENASKRVVSQVTALENSMESLQEQINRQTQDLVELEQLERNLKASQVLYDNVLARLKETTVLRGLHEADARVLSAAVEGAYVEPRKSVIIALSMILGAMAGAGFILLQQMMHNGFRTGEDLEAFTGLSVLGQIPKFPLPQRDGLIKYLNDKPTSAASEAIRNLRTSILMSNIDNPPQVIMLTSSVPGEGKTTQSIALAQNFSRMGKKVLLIEGDIRRRTFTQYFKQAPKGGILTALAGESPLSEVVFFAPELGADVLMGEKSNINAADVFSSEKFHNFLDKAREAYDIVIIDTPPVLVVPDARVIGQSVDAILYSVAWDDTARNQVGEGMRQLATANLRATGVVLARIDPKGMKRYGYGGKYGAYGAYGNGNGYYDN